MYKKNYFVDAYTLIEQNVEPLTISHITGQPLLNIICGIQGCFNYKLGYRWKGERSIFTQMKKMNGIARTHIIVAKNITA